LYPMDIFVQLQQYISTDFDVEYLLCLLKNSPIRADKKMRGAKE
jgi:hypothetical protein